LLQFRIRVWKKFWFRFCSWLRSGSRQHLAQFSTKNLNKMMPFQSQKHHYFPENWSLIYNFFNFFIPFYDRSGFKSGSGTESRSGTSTTRHSGSGSAKAKSYGSCRFDSGGSTTLVKGDIRDFLARIQLCVCLPSVCVYNAV
jgi:hypothetical protein